MAQLFFKSLLIVLFVCSAALSRSEQEQHKYKELLWQNAQGAIEQGNSRLARKTLQNALSMGLGLDSMMLGMARMHFYNGVLDSALFYNLSIYAKPGTHLKKAQLKQRYAIYTAMNAQGLRSTVADSLRSFSLHNPLRVALPSNVLSIKGGARHDREFTNSIVNDGINRSAYEDIGIREYYGATNTFWWKIPMGSRTSFRFGSSINSGKSHAKNLVLVRPDTLFSTLDFSANSYIGISQFARYFSLRATHKYANTYLGKSEHKVGGELSFAHISQSYLRLALSGSYALQKTSRSLNFTFLWDQTTLKDKGFFLSFFSSWLYSEPLQFNQGFSVFDTNFVFVQTYSDIENQSIPNSLTTLYESPINGILQFYQPQHLVSFNPSVGYQFSFSDFFRLRFSLAPLVTLYAQNTTWTQWGGPLPQGEDLIIEYDQKSGNYFSYNETSDTRHLIDFFTFDIKRVDVEPEANVTLDFPTQAGIFSLSSSVSRTWSNIKKYAPIAMPDFKTTLQAGWSISHFQK